MEQIINFPTCSQCHQNVGKHVVYTEANALNEVISEEYACDSCYLEFKANPCGVCNSVEVLAREYADCQLATVCLSCLHVDYVTSEQLQ